MASLLGRIGAFSARRRWFVLVAWILILGIALVGVVTLSKPFASGFSISGLSSIQANDTITKHFAGASHTSSGKVLIKTSGSSFSNADKTDVDTLALRLARVPDVTAAVSPFETKDAALSPISTDGRIAYITVVVDRGDIPSATSKRIEKIAEAASAGRLTVAADADLVPAESGPIVSSSSLIAIILALVVLLITFGALTAAGFTLLTALIGLVTSLLAIVTVTHFVSFNSVGLSLAVLLGLAVGIDYALFITSRVRKFLLEGFSIAEAIPAATRTAGNAVFFAALTVIVALSGLAVVGIGFLTQMGLAAAFAVFIAMLVSLTLTPALLATAGQRLLSKRARRRREAELASGTHQQKARVASAWMRQVQRRPWLFAIAPVIVIAVVALPVLGLRVGLPDAGSDAQPQAQQTAYNLYAEGFGAGANGPLEVLATYDRPATASDVAALASAAAPINNVAAVIPGGVEGHYALVVVVPRTGPHADATGALVNRLRASASLKDVAGSPAIAVTGDAAVNIDISQRLLDALPLYLAIIIVFVLLLMLIMFRSILIPIKAAISFVLSLGAGLGASVAVFQWGWLSNVYQVDVTGPILSFMPILVVGVLFGLSMDYETFLVSGIHERIAEGDEPRAAVRNGFATNAKVIVAAGVIMLIVFVGGSLKPGSDVQPIALALSVGVLVDVFLVRMTLVPAVLTIAGKWTWAVPRWLDRILPHLELEGEAVPVEVREPISV